MQAVLLICLVARACGASDDAELIARVVEPIAPIDLDGMSSSGGGEPWGLRIQHQQGQGSGSSWVESLQEALSHPSPLLAGGGGSTAAHVLTM